MGRSGRREEVGMRRVALEETLGIGLGAVLFRIVWTGLVTLVHVLPAGS